MAINGQFATLRMGRLKSDDNGVVDADPRDGTRRAMEHQDRASREIPIQVERVAWPNATGNERIPELHWNPADEAPEDPIATMPDSVLRASFGVADGEPGPLSFFNGKPHAEGLKAYRDHLASRGTR